jgi:hypothetical protein
MKKASSLGLACAISALVFVATAHAQIVRINEFMANNDTIASPATVKADWIELYNTTSSPVSLAGMYLSDNATNPTKWQFPSGTSIPANGYLVVWAYDTTYPGALYTTWALNKDGEHISLTAANMTVMDSVTFGPQTKNRTSARIPNGTGQFSSSCLPTLGAVNSCVVTNLTGGMVEREAAGLFLAPTGAGRILARFQLTSPGRAHLAVYDVRGREVALLQSGPVAAGTHVRTFDAAALPAGTYWFVLRAGAAEYVRSGVIVR